MYHNNSYFVNEVIILSSVVEKRRATIINLLYFAVVFAILYFGFELFAPLLAPFVVAFIVASILNKPIKAINKKIPILKRSMLSIVFVLLLVGIFAAVFFLIGMEIYEKIRGFIEYLMASFQDLSGLVNEIKLWMLDSTAFLPEAIRTVLHENVSLFFDNIIKNGLSDIPLDISAIDWSSLLSKGGAVLSGTVGQIPSFVIAVVIMIISTVFIINDYDRIVGFFFRQLSEENAEKLKKGWTLGVSSLKKMIKAYVLIILFTTFELTVGFYVLKFIGVLNMPYIILFAFIIALIDIIPVLGTGTVLLPWAVISFIMGNVGLGLGLLALYVIILIIRQVIEPKLVAGQVGLPPIVTIVAMYVGTKTLGVLGFFILPFVVILIKLLNDEGVIKVFKTAVTERMNELKKDKDSVSSETAAETQQNPGSSQ